MASEPIRAERQPAVLARDTEVRTQDRVRQMIASEGPISASNLAKSLGLTPAAVRRHLDHLTQQGVIEVKSIRSAASRAGRPSRFYVLSAVGQEGLGDDYLGLARQALSMLSESDPQAVLELAKARYAGFEKRVSAKLNRTDSIQEKARVLATALNQDGYVSSLSTLGAGRTLALQLCQGHCPLQGIASEYPEFCEQESEMFNRLLGVDTRRLSTLVSGSHVCTTHIPLSRERTGKQVEEHHNEGVRS